MPATVRGVPAPDEKEEPRFASQARRAMGKTASLWYFAMLTLSLRLLSLLPSESTRRPRWAKVGGCQPNAW